MYCRTCNKLKAEQQKRKRAPGLKCVAAETSPGPTAVAAGIKSLQPSTVPDLPGGEEMCTLPSRSADQIVEDATSAVGPTYTKRCTRSRQDTACGSTTRSVITRCVTRSVAGDDGHADQPGVGSPLSRRKRRHGDNNLNLERKEWIANKINDAKISEREDGKRWRRQCIPIGG